MDEENQLEVFNKITSDLAQEHQADIYLYSGEISQQGANEFTHKLSDSPSYSNALLLLGTYGGNPDAAYKIARALQRRYKHITLFVPGVCKSAGTLVALGADRIVLSEAGELGPLDVQLGKTDELWEMVSGLNINEALISLDTRVIDMFRKSLVDLRMGSEGTISTKLAAEIATNLSVSLYGPIYSQVDPLKLGEIERAIKIAYVYGERLIRGNLKPYALEQLVAGYPSHSYVIDIEEADNLFKQVRKATQTEDKLAAYFDDCLINPQQQHKITKLNDVNIDDKENTNEPENKSGLGTSSEGAEQDVSSPDQSTTDSERPDTASERKLDEVVPLDGTKLSTRKKN